MLSCSLPRTGIARQLGQIGATFIENILPIFGDKGRNDLSIYLLHPRKKNVRLGVPSSLSPIPPTPRTLSGPRAIVSCCFHLVVFFLVVDTGKTQPDNVYWLVVRGLLVSAYPKEKGTLIKKQEFDFFSCSPLAAGKESIYLPSFGRFPPTQSTEIPRIPWWISPTTQQQCGIDFLVRWI